MKNESMTEGSPFRLGDQVHESELDLHGIGVPDPHFADGMIAELRERAVEELDYSLEADAQRELGALMSRSDGERPWAIRDELATTMHENFGVFRREDQMQEQGRIIERLKERYERVVVEDKGDVFNNDLTQALELGFLLDLAECMVVAGLARKESRGAHARPYDYPERDDVNYLRHTITSLSPSGRVRLDWKPVTITKWQPQERTY